MSAGRPRVPVHRPARSADWQLTPGRLPDIMEGFECFREFVRTLPEPVEVHSRGGAEFSVGHRYHSLGGVGVADLGTTGRVRMDVRRGPRLVRQSDPECYCLLISTQGYTGISQDSRDGMLAPGDMGLYDTSRPHHGWRSADGHARLLMMTLPHRLVPVHPDTIRDLIAVPMPGNDGVAALVRRMAGELADGAASCTPADGARLAGVAADLVGVLLAHRLDASGSVAVDARQRTLMIRIQAFIDQRLADRQLSPGQIAAAHHIGIRTLHRLFHDHGLTVAGWIRQRRLDRCRRDLADPRFTVQYIDTIARRWAFADGAHLSRAFKSAYGISPAQWRASTNARH
jgi:AraC-like DNA-binding protein